MKNILILIFFFVLNNALSQELLGIHTTWDDDFREWSISWYDWQSEKEKEGKLKMRWILNNDWSEWDLSLDDYRGEIRQKWKNNPNIWELRANGSLIVANTIWRNDFSEWKIKSEDYTLRLKSKWKNNANHWQVSDDKPGLFEMITEWDNDPRDWVIYDELDESILMETKLLAAFLILFYSSPKN